MAFTEAQKVKIRLFLGVPDVFQMNDARLESAINVIGTRADTQAEVVTLLANLATADAKVNSVLTAAGIKKVDEIEFFPASVGSSQVSEARAYGRLWASRLSIIFGFPLQGDAFGTQGYQGDSWSREGFQVGCGGEIPLG
jgi:hypothetical protein